MRHGSIIILSVLVILGFLPGVPTACAATDVQFEAPPRVYLGLPFEVRLVIKESEGDVQPPSLTLPAGIEQVGQPSTSRFSQVSVVNGRMTRTNDLTVRYPMVARRAGTVVIPGFDFRVDGQRFTLADVAISVEEPDAGELLIVEVEVSDTTPYLGETVELTLKLWIREFVDSKFNMKLRGSDMWRRVDRNRSDWGPFATALDRSLPRASLLRPSALPSRPVARTTADGERQTYLLYEVRTQYRAGKTGVAQLPPVTVMMQYPVALGRNRFGELQITDERTLVASAEVASVEVQLPPATGRPESFTGAIGRYEMSVTAEPTAVAVGDPITLTIDIKDVSAFAYPPETVPPPSLAPLEGAFTVPSESMAGTSGDRLKRFTQTVRAKSDAIDAIPALTYAFFDPRTESYDTVTTPPIPITVSPVSMISVEDVVGTNGTREATRVTAVETGLRANETGAALLAAANARPPSRWWLAAALLVPPILGIGVRCGMAFARDHRADQAGQRRRQARRRAMSRLDAIDAHGDPAIAATVADYIADRLDVPRGTLTPPEIVDRLEYRGVDAAMRADVRAVLEAGLAAQYAGGGGDDQRDHRDTARQVIDRLERESW